MGIVARENKSHGVLGRDGILGCCQLPSRVGRLKILLHVPRFTHTQGVFLAALGTPPVFSSQKRMWQVYLRASEFRAG